jgi:UDP-N-acetylmuramate dehydrogenase
MTLAIFEIGKKLTHLNSFGFDAVAEKYIKIASESQLVDVMKSIKSESLSFQVLSGGSNLLMAPIVSGVTLHMQIKGKSIVSQTDEHVTLRVSGGENWHQLVAFTVENNWQGIENLALIPGLVGAAPVQNIGAYGTEFQEVVVQVRAYDTNSHCFVALANSQCGFSYRDSIFKQQQGEFIITSVDIKLSKKVVIEYRYQALKDYFLGKNIVDVSLQDIYQAICFIRAQKLPDPDIVPNAGSFFKNPCIARERFNELRALYPAIIGYDVSDSEVKVAAGWLIDSCGWKGYSKDGVGVYAKQALVLIHTKGSSLERLMALAGEIKHSIFEKYGIELEVEPQPFPKKS